MNNRKAVGAVLWAASVAAAFVAGALLTRGPDEATPPRGDGRTELRTVVRVPLPPTPGFSPDEDAAGALASVQQLLSDGSPTEFAEAVRAMANSWSEEDSALLQVCLEAWGQRDGAAALEQFSATSQDPEFVGWGLRHLLSGWARSDPAGALAWASDSTGSFAGVEGALLLTALRIAAKRGEDRAALSTAAALPAGSPRTAAADAIAAGIMHGKSFQQASQWYSQAAAVSPMAGPLVRPFSRRLFALDHQQSASWATELPNHTQRAEAITEIAQLWSRVEPAEAAAWAQELPAGEPRSQALGEITRSWAPIDAVAAGEWLGSLPPGRDVDRALAHYINDIAPTNPEVASRWVSLINDPLAHRAAVLRVSSHWRRTDPSAAADWRAQEGSRRASR